MTMDRDSQAAGASATDDRAAIGDLVHRYALLVRRRCGAGIASLFAEQSTYEVREIDRANPDAPPRLRNCLQGPDEIAAYVARSGMGPVRLFPLIHNLLIEIDGPTASATCLMQSKTFPPGHEVFGEYDDRFVRNGGEWRFSSRTYTILDAPWLRAEMAQ